MTIPLYVYITIIFVGAIGIGTAFGLQTFNEDVVISGSNQLGIGVANPSAPLDVKAGSQASGTNAIKFDKTRDAVNSVRYTFADAGGVSSDDGGGAFWRGVQFAAPKIVEDAQNKFPKLTLYSEYDTLTDPTQKLWILSANQNHDIAFRSANTDLMVLENDGNVGIGKSNPNEKLHVNGNIKLTGNILSNGDICIGTCP